MAMPLYKANETKDSFVSDTNEADPDSVNRHLTILDLAYSFIGTRALQIPQHFRHINSTFGKMVKVCLTH